MFNARAPRSIRLPGSPLTQRFFRSSSSANNDDVNNHAEDPYAVLGVARNSSYREVKASFLAQALQHHPDLAHHSRTDSNPQDAVARTTAMFIRIRHAFERIVETHKKTSAARARRTSGAGLDHDNADKDDNPVPPVPQWNSDAEFRVWFQRETSHHLTFDMCDRTRAEVIHVYNTMSPGGRDRGGYWDMARQLAEREMAAVVDQPGSRRDAPTMALPAPAKRNLRRQRNR